MDPIIQFRNVTKEYAVGENKLRAADDVSFEVQKGEFAVILGPSGAGKSTVLNLLGGMDRATKGSIIINGRDITKFDENGLTAYRRDEVGFVFKNVQGHEIKHRPIHFHFSHVDFRSGGFCRDQCGMVRHANRKGPILLAGGLIGIVIGPLIVPPIMFEMQKSLYILPAWYAVLSYADWISVAVAVLCCGASSYFACRKELKGVPAESMRPKPPKAGRHTRWEKSLMWKRLGFSTQWNVRDILRSRIRSIMAVIGVMGCMGLLLCALGIKDSMNGIASWMYGDLHIYENKINLKEAISEQETDALTKSYEGQLVQESGVELKTGGSEKTGTMTVLRPGEMIRFEDVNRNPVKLPDSGVALSYKMAVALNVNEGDRIEWRMMGESDWKTTTVEAVFRTPMGQGIAMTESAYKLSGKTMKPTALLLSGSADGADKMSGVKGIQNKADMQKSFDKTLESMQMMIGILILAAVILGIVVLYNLGALSFTERTRELATLKVLGFFPKQIRSLLNRQNVWLTSVGILLGIPCGYALIEFILSTMSDSTNILTRITTVSLVICVLGTLFLSMVVSFILSHKVKSIDMVSSLKAVE